MRTIGGIKIPEKDTYRVDSTFDYGKFKFIEGNRDVDHEKKLEESMRECGLLLQPILVNELYEIVEGQNRYTACMNLGLPIYYIVQPGIRLKEVKSLNSASKNWNTKNFIHSYALGDQNLNYIYVEQLMKAYPWANQSLITFALTGVSGWGSGINTYKSGDFKCTEAEYNKAVKVLDYVGQFEELLAYIEKKDSSVKWASGSEPTSLGSGLDRYGVYLVIENDVLTFIELEEFEDSDKKGKDVVSAKEFLGKSKSPHIVIFRRDRNVIAKDVATGNEGIAKCSPDDEFVFKTGASIAMARLIAQIPEVITGDVAAEWKKTLGIADTAKPESKFKLGDFVTLKEDVEADKWYGGLELLSGAMYDNAHNKRITVVRVDWSDDSNTYYYECKGDSRFTTFHYSEQMLDKWNESVIYEGDTVKVVNTGLNYSSYAQWVGKHISDPYMAARFCFGSPSLDEKYKVIKIAEHESNYRPLAYIEQIDGIGFNKCYLIEVKGLEKV